MKTRLLLVMVFIIIPAGLIFVRAEEVVNRFVVTPVIFAIPADVVLGDSSMVTGHLTMESICSALMPTVSPEFILDDAAFSSLLESIRKSGGALLSVPRIIQDEGQAAVFRIQEKTDYFEKQPDGSFQLKTLASHDSAGLILRASVLSCPDGNSVTGNNPEVKLSYDLEIIVIAEREPVAGTRLDVGEPTLHRKEIHDEHTVPLSEWVLLAVTGLQEWEGGNQDLLIILMQVDITGEKQ